MMQSPSYSCVFQQQNKSPCSGAGPKKKGWMELADVFCVFLAWIPWTSTVLSLDVGSFTI